MNYFELFGLEPEFDIDLSHLSETYQGLQKNTHPDKFAHASKQQQLIAAQKSAQINDGYQTLKDPIRRAEHLLQQRGIELASEQQTIGDTAFLMQQMELREMLEQLQHCSSDEADDAFMAASETLDSQYLSLYNSLQANLAQNSAESNTLAAELIRKLKFYQKLQLELEQIEAQLFD